MSSPPLPNESIPGNAHTYESNGRTYDVYKLIAQAEKLESTKTAVQEFEKILHDEYWCDSRGARITPRTVIDILRAFHQNYEAALMSHPEIAEHIQKIKNTNFEFPVLVSEDGELIDGMHRLARHVIDGEKVISVKVLTRHQMEKCQITDTDS